MKSIHWSVDEVLSKQRHINFILAERGVGKTFGVLEWAMNRAIKYGKQFVYMRRRNSELDKIDELFSPLNKYSKKKIVRNAEYKIIGSNIYANDKHVGYLFALSTSSHLKGSAFPDVETLIYDEFLIEKGSHMKELKMEVHKFYNMLETIFRMRDFRVFMLGNTTTFETCYKYEMKLQKPFGGQKYWYHPTKSILVQIADNPVYREAKMESPLGKLIEGTSYADYAVYNNFYMDSYVSVKKRTGTHYEILNFTYKGRKYGLYISKKEREMVIDFSTSDKTDFQIKDVDLTEEGVKILSKSSHPVFRYMRNYYNAGCLCYHNLTVKTQLKDLIIKIM